MNNCPHSSKCNNTVTTAEVVLELIMKDKENKSTAKQTIYFNHELVPSKIVPCQYQTIDGVIKTEES